MARKVSVKRFAETSRMLAKWPAAEREQIARDLLRDLPTDKISDLAGELRRRAYYAEIRALAEDFKRHVEAGEYASRNALLEAVDETVDGHHDVIYTACAMDVVCASDNSGAYVEEFGAEGATENGDIAWSRLAYAAMQRDLFEQLSAEGVDVNADFCDAHHRPACSVCE